MDQTMKSITGKVVTSRGPIDPAELGRVMMHEHLHSDSFDYDRNELITEEAPITEARRRLLMNEAVPYLKTCNEHGCHAFVDATMPPWRAWPTFYPEASNAADIHIVLCTGFYREIELGKYWAHKPEWQIWPFVRESSMEDLADFCVREIVEGIHGTEVHAGAIKLGTSQPEMTDTEVKTFRAGARAQKETGVHITTHCTQIGSETSQLEVLEEEGVDLDRVVIGHTAKHLMDPECRKVCIQWMKRGANFLPTNLKAPDDEGGRRWEPLVGAIHEIFDGGLGAKIAGFGLDWAFCSGEGQTDDGRFGACTFMPPPPFLHMFTHTLPAFRSMGLTVEEEDWIMERNPQRILPVK
jgi:predicted metal-dependent phosphotriesterase family hydrolase